MAGRCTATGFADSPAHGANMLILSEWEDQALLDIIGTYARRRRSRCRVITNKTSRLHAVVRSQLGTPKQRLWANRLESGLLAGSSRDADAGERHRTCIKRDESSVARAGGGEPRGQSRVNLCIQIVCSRQTPSEATVGSPLQTLRQPSPLPTPARPFQLREKASRAPNLRQCLSSRSPSRRPRPPGP